MQTLGAGFQDSRVMSFQTAGDGEAQQYRLRKLIAVQVGKMLGLHHAGDCCAGTRDPSHTQPGERNLGKTAKQNGVAGAVHLFERR